MEQETKDQKTTSNGINPQYLIPGSILIAGVVVAFAIMYTTGGGKGGAKPLPNDGQAAAVAASGDAAALLEAREGDYVLGNPAATVTFVEFGDFQCPFCERFYKTTEKELIEKYVKTGKVKFIWRDFAFLGKESFWAAEAARCAGDQGKFWDYHDHLFEQQRGENQGVFSNRNLKRFADELKLDTDLFNTCLDSGKYRDAVEEESRLGRELGVSGTPSSFINGRNITGAVPFSSLEPIILDALEER
ncbi:DsbA family protein [Patescibacteria group bacterium]|nr:DsbA family protein [Patescibacteria group bacterium]